MMSPLGRTSLAAQILLVLVAFLTGLMLFIYANMRRAVLEGSTEITVESYESMIRGIAEEIADGGQDADPSALEARFAAIRDRNPLLESLMLVSGRTVVASAEPGKSGTEMGGGAAEKAAEVLAVQIEGNPRSEVEKRSDITPRFTFIYPVKRDGAVAGALVAKFSLEQEFGAIEHLRLALTRMLLVAGIAGGPVLFALLWLMVIRPLRRLRKAAVRLSEGVFDIALPAGSSAEIRGVTGAVLEAASSIKAHYERYLSPQVVALLQAEKGFLKDIRMRTRAAVLTCDIEGFTSMSEGMDVDRLGLFLNRYFEAMTEILFARGGTLDKYMGDGILAIFGAPVQTERYRADAVEAAFSMVSAFSARYRDWLSTPGRETTASSRIRVGIACGEVFYGNVGYARRSDFTALGNAVNLASRLQDLNKTTGTTILIDGETRAGLPESDARFRPVDPIQVRGFSRPVSLYGA